MSAFARYLVAAGITSSGFARIARLAFFRAASEDAKFTNSRVNRSAVAAMTGLTRAQVREFTQAQKPVLGDKPDYIDRLIRGWSTDVAFTTSSNLPRPLSISGKNAAFGLLASKYGGDIPARSILREMVRNQLVLVKGSRAHLKHRARQTKAQTQLQHLSQLLSVLLHRPKAVSKSTHSLRSVLGGVMYPSSSAKGRALLQRQSEERVRTFLAELEAAGIAASIETPSNKKLKGIIARTQIMVVTEEFDCSKAVPKSGK